jgi:hypothetical protein
MILALTAVCGAIAAQPASAGTAAGLTGTYRATVTARSLRATGVPAQEASFDAGTWTLTLAPGHWTMRQQHGVLGNALAEGDLKVAGSRALFTLTRIDGVPHHEFAGPLHWRASPSSLRFTRAGVAQIYELYVLVARPWTRTG